jgi:hypothetical protein
MKRLWISVKRGLIREPKHRLAMGECVWLFQYMLDIADWETGKIVDWKDQAAADDMQMPIRTLREQRRKLEEGLYISSIQKRYGQEVTIKNWTNPRSYTGEVLNKKQGSNETSPQKDEQGYTKGYTKGSTQDVTPTYDSNIKQQKKGDIIDGLLFFGKQAKEQEVDKVEELLQEMERGLHVNITRSASHQATAKKILKDGRPFGQWLTWCISDEWRAAHLYIYADLDKIWRDFPQAFENTTGLNPQGLEIGT